MKKKLLMFMLMGLATVAFMAVSVQQSHAWSGMVCGRSLTIQGYLQQTLGWNLENENNHDTKKDFQSALFQALVETTYQLDPTMRVFVSFKYNADWAYMLYNEDKEFLDKDFHSSRNTMYAFNNFRDILGEANIGWKPNDQLFVKVGRQIVAWGETDGFRLMDQINPLDQRRGMSDVQFENTILPLWLLRVDYEVPTLPNWLQALQVQAIFNPNFEFRANEHIVPGNDLFGLWAANIQVGPDTYVGRFYGSADNADGDFESKNMEFGLRLRAIVKDAIITVNGFYGRDNDEVRILNGIPSVTFDGTGSALVHLPLARYYPIIKFLGATFSRDITAIRIPALGGVSPVIRAEGMYLWDFTTMDTTGGTPMSFHKSNEIRWMVGADWKVRIGFINPRNFITISPQFYHRYITKYPHGDLFGASHKLGDVAGDLEKNNYITSLMVTTNYKNSTIIPFAFWMRDITNRADMYIFKISYVPTEVWKFTLGALILNSSAQDIRIGNGFKPLEHKDQVFFTTMYQF